MTYRIGLGSTVSSNPTEIRFTDHGRESTDAIVIDAAAEDAENTPTTTLRKGLVLGKVTETGKYKQYDDTAEDGTAVARLILEDEVDLLDDTGAAADTEALGSFRGDFIASALIGLDANGRADLAHCVFDDEV